MHEAHRHRFLPTAEATRLTEPQRTSPAAKTPGRLVSSRNGGRPAVRQRSVSCVVGGSSVPVRTKPFLLGTQREHSAVFRHPVGDDRGPAGERVHVTGELAHAMERDGAVLFTRGVYDLDRALEDDVESEAAIAGMEEHLAGADVARPAPGRQSREITLGEGGKGDVEVGGHGRVSYQ